MNNKSEIVSKTILANDVVVNDPDRVKEMFKYGLVPKIYVPRRDWFKKPLNPGILSEIKNAESVDRVNSLLSHAKSSYVKASPGTVKKWEKAANSRIAEINS